MKIFRLLRILIFSLTTAVGINFFKNELRTVNQASLAQEVCALVSRPLETGLLRETFEGMETALKARGELSACVSVTDNGRSYSPDCYNPAKKYESVVCQGLGNTGVRAVIAFERPGFFNLSLAYLCLGVFAVFLLLALAFDFLAKAVADVYSIEIEKLLLSTQTSHKESWLAQFARVTMQKTGISENLAEKSARFQQQLKEYEHKVETAMSAKSRYEQQVISAEEYTEKVKQIRHDLKSPLSSLQSIYEKFEKADSQASKALSTAIRRIQLLVDDLNEVDHAKEPPRLVIAEVALEEITILMRTKYQDIKSAHLKLSYGPEFLSPIQVGLKAFQSTIENLLENALEAIPAGGIVTVNISSNQGVCKITVDDNGFGISEENLPKLFTHGGSFGKLNGLGLGLYHAKKNVVGWGGIIECEKLEPGTRFTIKIPLAQTGVVFTSLPGNRRIKVIDDDEQVHAVLKKSGFEVLDSSMTYADGKRLLGDGVSNEFSILVDMRLDQGQLGADLIAQQTGRKRIFLCTNEFDDLTVIKRARELGVRIIPKPLCFYTNREG